MHIDTKCIHAGGYPDTQTKGINTPKDDLIEHIQQALEKEK